MPTFVLIHGAGDSGWAWHLLEDELRQRGHRTVAPDLPSEDIAATFSDYADAVVDAVEKGGEVSDVVVVGHSLGGFTAPLVAERLGARQLIMLAAMIPQPGETANEWWSTTGYVQAARTQSEIDGGLTGNADEMISFYNGVPRDVAREAQQHAQGQSEAPMDQPWPSASWPAVSTRFVLCRDDRFFTAVFFRTLVPERLGITPEEISGGHCVMLGAPRELADVLTAGLN